MMPIIRDRFDGGQPSTVDMGEATEEELVSLAMMGVLDAVGELLKRGWGTQSASDTPRSLYEQVRFNPHHDKLGKFTSKGAGAGSVAGTIDAGTRMSDLTPAGRAAVAANDARFGVTRQAVERELEAAMTPANIAAGRRWYPDARAFNEGLAKRAGLSVQQATAITAAVSPRTPWPRNKVLAERIALTHKDYKDADPVAAAKRMGGGMSTTMGKGVAIARGADISSTLSGPKCRSFYNNMLAPGRTDHVTVDTWMQRTAMRAASKPMSLDQSLDYLNAARTSTKGVGAGYVTIAEATRAVANRHGITPDEAQSAYWVAVSGGPSGGHPGKG